MFVIQYMTKLKGQPGFRSEVDSIRIEDGENLAGELPRKQLQLPTIAQLQA